MTGEERVRAAAEELVEAIVALAAESATRPPAPERLLSIDEAAAALGIGRTRLYAELGSGRLRRVKAGRRVLIPASEVGRLADGA